MLFPFIPSHEKENYILPCKLSFFFLSYRSSFLVRTIKLNRFSSELFCYFLCFQKCVFVFFVDSFFSFFPSPRVTKGLRFAPICEVYCAWPGLAQTFGQHRAGGPKTVDTHTNGWTACPRYQQIMLLHKKREINK